MSHCDRIVAAALAARRKQGSVDKSPFGFGKSALEKSKKRTIVAGGGARGVAGGHERHRERHDGEGAAGVSHFGFTVGGVDIFGGAAATQNQIG